MNGAVPPRGRGFALALAVALAGALALWSWNARDEGPTGGSAAPSSLHGPAPLGESFVPDVEPHPAPSVAPLSEPSPPAPAVFDFAKMTPPAQPPAEEERFRTDDRFTEEDLRHPERYFDLAARVPELNRPEERRDVLDYFVAYRQKLERDLEAAGDSEREEILVVIERYDAAIGRLRKLVGEGARR